MLNLKMADAFASIMARTGEDDYLILEKFKSSFKEIMNEDVSNLEDASKLLQRLTGETNLATKEFSNLQSFLASMNFGNVSSETEEIEENVQTLSSTLSDVKGKVQPLNKVLKELEKVIN